MKFIKALQESEDFYISTDLQGNSGEKIDPVEKGNEIINILELALQDVRNLKKRILDALPKLPENSIERGEFESNLVYVIQKEKETQEVLARVVKAKESIQKMNAQPQDVGEEASEADSKVNDSSGLSQNQ